jgi:hydroxymethylbilane synthase
LHFYGLLISRDGGESVETTREGLAADAASLGADAGRELKGRASAALLAALA